MRTEILDCVLGTLRFLETIWSWNLVIEVDLLPVEDEDASSGDNIALRVNKITTAVHETPILVV